MKKLKNMLGKTNSKYLAAIAAVQASVFASSAYAGGGSSGKKVSDIFGNLGEEVKTILPWIFTMAAAGGAVIVIVAIWSIISSKKNREPLTWQMWGLLGGGGLAVAGFVLMAVVGSIADGESGTGSFGELDLNYK